MKLYIIEKTILLFVGIVIVLDIPYLWPGTVSIVIRTILIIIAWAWGLRCWQVALLPLDLIIGKKVKNGHFSKIYFLQTYDVFSRHYYAVGAFCEKNHRTDLTIPSACSRPLKKADLTIPSSYYQSDKRVGIIVPSPGSQQETPFDELPPENVPVTVEYYPLSKLVIRWKLIEKSSQR